MSMWSSNHSPLAHSARRGSPGQSYREHVANVCRLAARFAREAVKYSERWQESFQPVVEWSATYHDLGKLDEIFQDILGHNRPNEEGFNHVEAGTTHLKNLKLGEAALCCFSHHIGLPSLPEEREKCDRGPFFLRDEKELSGIDVLSWKRTDELLDGYLRQHADVVEPFFAGDPRPCRFTGLVRRLALSCLVDGDHSDTAQHYREERELDGAPLRTAERLEALDRYVGSLGGNQSSKSHAEKERLRLRQSLYYACRDRKLETSQRMVACDSPVGTGKTSAVMAHLLRVAIERDLRRVFVVLPFTNIIDQSVDVYRKALVLPGEDPESVVAAHHHRVEFSGEQWRELRQLAQRWEAPIVVTTAVQFFETLASNRTAALRKLHQVPGSAVFVDEAHAAVPGPLWPQHWRWLQELCDDWNCHVVLASGSLPRFWELEDFVPAERRPPVPQLVVGELKDQADASEGRRVYLKSRGDDPLSLEKLADFVLEKDKPGPGLVILNTVQSAAVLAKFLWSRFYPGREWTGETDSRVEHLSTAICPAHRAPIVSRIRQRLGNRDDRDWILVATSCIEAGVDFSFRTAFRERCSLTSLLQVAGRVNRDGESTQAEVWDFAHDASGSLNLHPKFEGSRKVLAKMFVEHGERLGPQHCTEALRREVNSGFGETEIMARDIIDAEKREDYPEVAKLCRIIATNTRTVLVSQDLIERFRAGDPKEFPSPLEVMRYSVQVYPNKRNDLPVTRPLSPDGELVGIQPNCYDEFLGYMKGLLPLLESQRDGGIVV